MLPPEGKFSSELTNDNTNSSGLELLSTTGSGRELLEIDTAC